MLRRLVLTWAVFSALVTAVAAAPTSPAPTAVAQGAGSAGRLNPLTETVYKAFVGAWVGALEYRDYSSDEQVILPTIVHIRRAEDARSLALHYIYDDGPTKVAQDSETVTIDPVASTYVTVSGDGKDVSKDTLTGLKSFAGSGQGTLVRSGSGIENGKTVDVRTILTLSPNTLTILKETRAPGQAFLFRDRYTLTRVVPATIGR